jgi:hypothetical protein
MTRSGGGGKWDCGRRGLNASLLNGSGTKLPSARAGMLAGGRQSYLAMPSLRFFTSSSLQRRFRDTEESLFFFAWLGVPPLPPPPPPRRSLGLKEEPTAGLESRSGGLAGEPPEASASSSVLHCNGAHEDGSDNKHDREKARRCGGKQAQQAKHGF